MPAPEPAREAGFSLVEVLVSVALIGVVMTASTSFFASTISVTNRQSGKQAAVRLGYDGAERVRALAGSAVVTGRDRTSTDNQWASPVTGVAPYLADMQRTWDPAATFPAGASAALPTTATSVLVDGVSYGQHWYVGRCWQPRTGGDCGPVQGAGFVEFLRVVVAVTWSERQCPGALCSYVTSTLVSDGFGEPVFNPNQNAQPPAVTNPGDQVGEVSVPVSLQLAAAGGAPPVTWSGTGLPAGLAISSSGLITGTPSAAGTHAVQVSATDGLQHVGTAAFTWTVNALPQLVAPPDQATTVGTPVSLAIARTGGTAPLTWSVTQPGPWGPTGLPPGLALDPATGVISGTPTTAGPARAVTVTVTDNFGRSASATFTWTVSSLQVQTPPAQADEAGRGVTPLQVVATGGTTPYEWSATGLPPGLAIHPNGKITGSARAEGVYTVTVTVTDAAAARASTDGFRWTIE